jgi:RHS repeat-associated protein
MATIIHNATNAGVYFPVYDGNGNVMGYVRGADGVLVAQYEYGPFGELLRSTGPLAFAFPHLFSTKHLDWETSLYSYGHRYYSPTPGRWLSRDPIGERGGINLYGFVCNNPVNRFDGLGLDANTPSSTITPWKLGWEWLTGNGPRHRDFGPGDYMTEGLRQMGHSKLLNTQAKLSMSLVAARALWMGTAVGQSSNIRVFGCCAFIGRSLMGFNRVMGTCSTF